jgi:Tol biopolymer transport system component/DNA-binding winged helix-turn-helix (wHTH) protein
VETQLPVLRFDQFELDLNRYELRRAGRRIKLQRVPMELLILLVEQGGSLASRDEIVVRLWGRDVHVDAERSINTAIRKIRQALDDDAANPRFVETVVGKGYRFIAAVSSAPQARAVANPQLADPVPQAQILASPRAELPRQDGSWAGISLAAAVALAAGILTFWLSSPWRKAEPMKIVPFTAFPGIEFGPAFSPDGKQVAFAWATPEGGQHIYLKAVGAGSPLKLTDAVERDSNPSWSPDGRSIAFLRQETPSQMALYVMRAAGGGERRIRKLGSAKRFRPGWSYDGNALAVMDSEAQGAPSGIFRISMDTGEARRLTTAPPTSSGDWSPAFSPDGRTLAFLRNSGSALTSVLYLLAVDRKGAATGKARTLQSGRSDLTSLDWSADGQSLICGTHAGLVRVPASGGASEPLPFPDASEPSASRQLNRLVYAQSVRDTDIFRLPGPDGTGGMTDLISSTRADGAPGYSPDGRRIVFVSQRSGSEQLWLADSEGQHVRQLTSLARGAAGCPRWSPDGQRIAFDSTEQGRGNIYEVAVDSGAIRQITSGASTNVRPAWSRDGAWIYFGSDRGGSWEVWKTMPRSATPVQVTHGGGREAFEDPAGKFLYYTKERSTPGIWRMDLSSRQAERVSEEGAQGRWAVGERGIYYVDGHGGLELTEFSTQRHVPIPTPGLMPETGFGGGLLTIAPGDRSILVTILMRADSDLTLVENFR